MPWPTLPSSTSSTTLTINPRLVNPVGFFDDRNDPNAVLSRTNAVTLASTISKTTLASGDAATTNPEGWASAQGWDKHRARITELYPKLMLKEIMELMALEYNFRAT